MKISWIRTAWAGEVSQEALQPHTQLLSIHRELPTPLAH